VRERKLISLPDAIRKMTLIPAQILGDAVPQMRNKGRLHPGSDADIVVFDPAAVGDRATYAKPAQTSAGMRWVIVNGAPVIADGQLDLKALPGRPIRRAH
jgi:N-acyl-D-glutamate deacylase